MKKEDYEKLSTDLFKRWNEARPEYTGEGKRFTPDGILNYKLWEKSKPKILFLLKENHSSDWDPADGFTVTGKTFSQNIALWRQVIKDQFNNPNKELSFFELVLPKDINDIAIVEVKKLNEGKGKSEDNDILSYAVNDKDFLKEQFEIINPDIVLCGSTIDYYGNNIYGDDAWDEEHSNSFGVWYKHGNRLVINFCHPSAFNKRPEEFFEILSGLIENGKIFEKFDWGKSG